MKHNIRLTILIVLAIWFLVGFAPPELVPVSGCAEFDMIFNGKQQLEAQPDAFEFFKEMQGVNALTDKPIEIDEADPEFFLFEGLVGDTDPTAKKVIYVALLQAGDSYYIMPIMMDVESDNVYAVILNVTDKDNISICGAYAVDAVDVLRLWILLK